MRIIEKATGKEVYFNNRQLILKNILSPIKEIFCSNSDTMQEAIDMYADVKLKKHKLTNKNLTELKKDPGYIEHIPRYDVKGYDQYVVSQEFELKLRNEFYKKFISDDQKLIRLVNKYHDRFALVV